MGNLSIVNWHISRYSLAAIRNSRVPRSASSRITRVERLAIRRPPPSLRTAVDDGSDAPDIIVTRRGPRSGHPDSCRLAADRICLGHTHSLCRDYLQVHNLSPAKRRSLPISAGKRRGTITKALNRTRFWVEASTSGDAMIEGP